MGTRGVTFVQHCLCVPCPQESQSSSTPAQIGGPRLGHLLTWLCWVASDNGSQGAGGPEALRRLQKSWQLPRGLLGIWLDICRTPCGHAEGKPQVGHLLFLRTFVWHADACHMGGLAPCQRADWLQVPKSPPMSGYSLISTDGHQSKRVAGPVI